MIEAVLPRLKALALLGRALLIAGTWLIGIATLLKDAREDRKQ